MSRLAACNVACVGPTAMQLRKDRRHVATVPSDVSLAFFWLLKPPLSWRRGDAVSACAPATEVCARGHRVDPTVPNQDDLVFRGSISHSCSYLLMFHRH